MHALTRRPASALRFVAATAAVAVLPAACDAAGTSPAAPDRVPTVRRSSDGFEVRRFGADHRGSESPAALLLVAPWPYSRWDRLPESSTAQEPWRRLPNTLGDRFAVQWEVQGRDGVFPSPVAFVGGSAAFQRWAELDESVWLPVVPGRVSVRPFDGAVRIDVAAEGAGRVFRWLSPASGCSVADADAWAVLPGLRLINTDPPAVRLGTGEIAALESDPSQAGATVRLRSRLPGSSVTIDARRRSLGDGAEWETTIEAGDERAVFVGPPWGAGGELMPRSFQATSGPMATSSPWRLFGTEAVVPGRFEYSFAEGVVSRVEIAEDGGIAVSRSGGAEWRLLPHAPSSGPEGPERVIEGRGAVEGEPIRRYRVRFDGRGRARQFEPPSGEVVTLRWDADDRVVSVTRGNGVAWTFQYGRDPQTTEVAVPDGTRLRYEFEGRGMLRSLRNGAEERITRVFDGEGRIRTETSDDVTRDFAYGPDGGVTVRVRRGKSE